MTEFYGGATVSNTEHQYAISPSSDGAATSNDVMIRAAKIRRIGPCEPLAATSNVISGANVGVPLLSSQISVEEGTMRRNDIEDDDGLAGEEGDEGGAEYDEERDDDIEEAGGSEGEELHDEEFSDGEYYSDEELSDEEEGEELCEESLLKIERNDPALLSLLVRRFPRHINGKDIGEIVGDSMHLKKCIIDGKFFYWEGDSDSDTNSSRKWTLDWLKDFCTGAARSRSIDELSLRECPLATADDGNVSSMMATISSWFMNSDRKLHSLEISGCAMGDKGVRQLAAALSQKCDKTLMRRLNLDANEIGDDAGRMLIDSLGGYDQLSELSLSDNEIGTRGCVALRNLLPQLSNLSKLNLENNSIDDDGIVALTMGLMDANKKSTMKFELNLSLNGDITQVGWRTFGECLRAPYCKIQKLDVSSNNITEEGATVLGNSLAKNETIKVLNLYDQNSNGMPLIGSMGCHALFSSLRNEKCTLEEIDLRYNTIAEEGLPVLVDALAGNSTLKMLDLSHNNQVTVDGWKSFFSRLQCTRFAIQSLHLGDNEITDEVISIFAHILTKNEMLETLTLDNACMHLDHSITDAGWSHISRALCDQSSAASIHSSNHTLCEITGGKSSKLPEELRSLLQVNRRHYRRKGVAAREKILRFHFRTNDASMITQDDNLWKFFIDADLEVLPHALSWLCRDGDGHTLLYKILRSLPALLLNQGNEGKCEFGVKRKWVSDERKRGM